MNIIEEATVLFRESEFEISSSGDIESFFFEDASIFGCLSVHRTAAEIVDSWSSQQAKFLQTHSRSMHRAEGKAWNAYTVMLAGEPCSREEQSSLIRIEEDFEATRKIVRSGVDTRRKLVEAVLPLMTLQRTVRLSPEDPLERLRDEIKELDAAFLVFLEDKTADEISLDLI